MDQLLKELDCAYPVGHEVIISKLNFYDPPLSHKIMIWKPNPKGWSFDIYWDGQTLYNSKREKFTDGTAALIWCLAEIKKHNV